MNKDINKRQERKNGKSRLRAGTAARFIAVMLTFMMVATWPMMSGSVFAVDDDNPSTVTQDVNGGNTDQVAPQDESGTQDQGDQGTQQEPAGNEGQQDQGSQDQQGQENSGQNNGGSSKDKSGDKDDGSVLPKTDKDKKDPAEAYKNLITINELCDLSMDVAKATIEYVGEDTGRVANKSRGWGANIYYVKQDDPYKVTMTKDFSLKYQIEFTSVKDIDAGKVEIRVPLSLVKYKNDGDGEQVGPSKIGVPEGTKGSATEKKDTFFNYYIDNDTNEIVFFNYEKIEKGTASAWQILYEDIDVSKVVDGANWAIVPDVTVKTKNGEQKLDEGEVTPIKGSVEYTAEEEENKDEDKTDDEAAAEEGKDLNAPASLDELKELDDDVAQAIEFKDKKKGKQIKADEGPFWDYDIYYLNQNDPNYVYKTDNFSLKYQMEFHNSVHLDQYAIEIRVPISTVKYGHGNETRKDVAPDDIGIPEGSYNKETGEYTFVEAKRSDFNYYIDEDTNELVFFNYRDIGAGSNNAWQVLYKGFDVMEIEDCYEWSIKPDVKVNVLGEEQTLEDLDHTIYPLEGLVDTQINLQSVTKKPYRSGASYTPGLYTMKQLRSYAPNADSVVIPDTDEKHPGEKLIDNFEDYKFVVWEIETKGYATQPYDLIINENTYFYDMGIYDGSSGFFVGVYDTQGTTLKARTPEEGQPASYRTYDAAKYSKSRSMNRKYRVVTAYPADKVRANYTTLYNNAEVTMVPYDRDNGPDVVSTDSDQYMSSQANWSWVDYDWKYSGDIIGIVKNLTGSKNLNSWTTVYNLDESNRDLRTTTFSTTGTCRTFAFTHKLEKINGQPYTNPIPMDNGIIGDYIPGTYVKVTTTDDFVYAYPQEGQNAGGKFKLTKDDYYFNNVSVRLNDNGYDIFEDTSGQTVPVSETGDLDRDMHVFAMFEDSDDWEEVAVVPWTSSGGLSYTFTSDQLARKPWRVKVEHNAVDYVTYSYIDVGITIKGDSPVFAQFSDSSSIQLENISGISGQRLYNGEPVGGNNGYFQDQSTTNYSQYEAQGLLNDTLELYKTVLMRDNAITNLLGEQRHAHAKKLGRAYNDPEHGRASVRYRMEAFEGYSVFSQEAVDYLKGNDNVPQPNRKEVVFYDLLPYGVVFDPSGKVTAGRIKSTNYSGDINESSWDKSQVTVTVDPSTDIIRNWRGTGRTMVIFHVEYSGRDSSVYSSGEWFTGFGVAFDAYCGYENYEAATERPNIVAYMPGNNETDEIIGTPSEVSKDDGNVVSSDGFARYYREMGSDIDEDNNLDERNVLYAQSQVFTDIAISTGSKIEKTVRADTDPFGQFNESAMTTPGKGYEYKVTVNNPTKFNLHDIVIFDRLETARTDRQAEEPDTFEDDDWKGIFDEVNLAELQARGINPVVYYNADRYAKIPRNGQTGENPHDILDDPANGWVKASNWTGSKEDVKAIAVDFGSSFKLETDDSISIYIHMIAPDELPDADWAYNYAGFYSFQDGTNTKSTEYCDSVKVKLVDSRELILEKQIGEDTPAARKSDSFKFYLEWDDGKSNKIYDYKEYTLYQKNSDGEWVEQSGIHATDADGALVLKDGQRAMFNGIDAEYIKVKEKESIRWDVEYEDETEEGIRTVTAVNTFTPLLYVQKSVKGYPASQIKEVNLMPFKMRLTDANGNPVKNKEFYVVTRPVTNGSEPVIVADAEHKLYGDLVAVPVSERPEGTRSLKTDENGEFVIYPGETIAFTADRTGATYTVTENEECYSVETDWMCEQPEVSGSVSANGTLLTITNLSRWKDLKIIKKITKAGDNDVSDQEFTFKIYKGDSENPDEKGDVIKDFQWQLVDSESAEPDEDAWQDPAEDGSITAACANKVIIVKQFKAGTDVVVEEILGDDVSKNFRAEKENIFVSVPTYASAARAEFVNEWKYRDLEVAKTLITNQGDTLYYPFEAVLETAPEGTEDWAPVKDAEFEVYDTDGNKLYIYQNGPTTEYDEDGVIWEGMNGMHTGSGVDPDVPGTMEEGHFTLLSGTVVKFKDLDVVGTKWRVREVAYEWAKPLNPEIDEDATETITEEYPDGSSYTYKRYYSEYISGTLQDENRADFLNSTGDGTITIRKKWSGNDETSQAYVESNDFYQSSYFMLRTDVPLKVLSQSSNAYYYSSRYWDYENQKYVPGIEFRGGDGYITLTLDTSSGNHYDLSSAEISVTEVMGSYSTNPIDDYQIYGYGAFQGKVFQLALDEQGATHEIDPTTMPVDVFENHLMTVGSVVQKRMEGANVPAGSKLVWQVEQYKNGKWSPAEGVKYKIGSYTFQSNGSSQMAPPLKGISGTTGSDGKIVLEATDTFYRSYDSITNDYGYTNWVNSVGYVTFDRLVYVNHFGKAVQEGDYRVKEVISESDEEWGVQKSYTTTPVLAPGATYPNPNYYDAATAGSNTATGFVNTTKMAKLRIEKVVDKPTDRMFKFKIEQYVHLTSYEELEPGANLKYTIYDSETDEVVREGVTTAKGELELQGGQYALVDVPPMSRWKVTEENAAPYYIEKIDVSGTVDESGGNSGEVSLAGDPNELTRKSDMVRADFVNALMQLAEKNGYPQNTSLVKNVYFGSTSQYPDAATGKNVVMDTKGMGTILGYMKENSDGTVDVYILSDDPMYTNTDSSAMFNGLYNVETIQFDNISTEKTTNMNNMFSSCNSLKNVNTEIFDTSKVTDMYAMFEYCNSLDDINVSSFDTSNVENMGYMFAYCNNLESIDISNFDTSSCHDVSDMFYGDSKLTEIEGIKDFVGSTVQYAYSMFSGCTSLEELDLSGWDISGIYSYYYGGTSGYNGLQSIFSNCGVKELDLSDWDVSNMLDLTNLFNNANKLEKVDLSGWNTENLGSTRYMFQNCPSLKEADLSDWNTKNLQNTEYMFAYCSSLEDVDLSGWDVSRLTSANYMFRNCTSLKEIDLTGMTNNGTNTLSANYMFNGCSSLETVKLDNGFGKNLYYAQYMFQNCSSLKDFDSGDYDANRLYNALYMFAGCTSLTDLDLSSWTTNNLYNACYMFSGCTNLKTLDLHNFKTNNLGGSTSYSSTSTSNGGALYMFNNCRSLETLDITNMQGKSYSRANWCSYMFTGCQSLSTIYNNYNWYSQFGRTSSLPYSPFSGCSSLPGWTSSKTGLAYAKPVSEGGYFTPNN